MTYQAKMIDGGKIVIPAELRRELGLKTGDMVAIDRDNMGALVLKPFSQVVREVQARVKASITQPFTVDDFIAERRAEAERENAKWERLANDAAHAAKKAHR